MCPSIIHVEDDPAISAFVHVVFQRLGFGGRMLGASTVAEGLARVEELRSEGTGPDLIITDMELPDGSGLDLLRRIKGLPATASIPVLVLSGRSDQPTVDEAYALGANCYVSKMPPSGSIVDTLESMYRFWMEGVLLPDPNETVTPRSLLVTAEGLRLGVAEVYAKLARRFGNDPDFSRFWLNLSLNEGNFANLLSFFRNRLEDRDVPISDLGRLRDQQRVRTTNLKRVQEALIDNPTPTADDALAHAARLTEGVEDRELATVLSLLFPRGPVMARMLTERMVAHWCELTSRFESRPEHPTLARSAAELRSHIRIARATAASLDTSTPGADH